MPEQTGDRMFGLPWRQAMWLVHGAGFLMGAMVFRIVGFGWCPAVVRGSPDKADWTCTMSPSGLLIVLAGSAIISAIAFFGNFEETWHRQGILAVAGGFLLFGLWVLAIHRIEIHSDRVVVRGPISPVPATFSLSNGNRMVTRIQRVMSHQWRFGRRRGSRISVHRIRPDGSEAAVCRGPWAGPLWRWASNRFEQEYLDDSTRGAREQGN